MNLSHQLLIQLSVYAFNLHCRCVTNILKISMKKFDPENNMIYLQGFEHSYIQAAPHCGGILKALLAANFLLFLDISS